MGRRVELSVEQESVLVAAYRSRIVFRDVTSAMADIGVHLCEDTLRRILVRLGEIDPVGAKYIPSTKTTWSRPCIRCGSRARRSRNLYFCARCQDHLRRQGDY